jgi:hypothetical protein
MAGTVSQSVLSTQLVQVLANVLSPSGYDPTGDVVQFAFTLETYPQTSPSAWYTGSWVTFPGPAYWAQCLVGPLAPESGGVSLVLGLYQIWVKITASPEVPVIQAGFLQITP